MDNLTLSGPEAVQIDYNKPARIQFEFQPAVVPVLNDAYLHATHEAIKTFLRAQGLEPETNPFGLVGVVLTQDQRDQLTGIIRGAAPVKDVQFVSLEPHQKPEENFVYEGY